MKTKFKAIYCKDDKEYMVSTLFYDKEFNCYAVDLMDKDNSEPCIHASIKEVKLKQYTGLNDMDGRELYYDDIVKGDFRRNIPGKVDLIQAQAQIKYYNGCFYLCFVEDTVKQPMHNLEITILSDSLCVIIKKI